MKFSTYNYDCNSISNSSNCEDESTKISEAFINEKNYTRLNNRTISYVFPLIYFFTSTLFLVLILVVNLLKGEEIAENNDNFPIHPFPGFYLLKNTQPNVYIASIVIISISGFLNVWFFCSLLLQRFSVPELRSNKLTVHLMFLLGIFGHVVFIFFCYCPEILDLEKERLAEIKVSLSMIIFLTYIFFNLFFSVLVLKVLENFRTRIAYHDVRLKRNIRFKIYLVYMALFLIILYVSAIFVHTELKREHFDKDKIFRNYEPLLKGFLFIIPYILITSIAVINLTYYDDINYMEDIINLVVDREYFMSNEESNHFLSNMSV